MVRFKFFVFALLVLGLGLAHLPLVSGPLSARATEDASAPATAAIAEVSRAFDARRLAVQGLALKLAASPDVATAVQPQVVPLPKGKGIRIVEPPTGERFAALRTAAKELVPESLAGSLVLALATSDGTMYALAEGEPAADDKLDVQALSKAGAEGVQVDAFDAPHVFYSVPVLWNPEGGRSQVAVTLVVGAPLVDGKVLESAALASGVAAIALVQGEKVLGTAGAQKELADEGIKVLRKGQSGHVVQSGSVRGWLPQLPQVKLPLFTSFEDVKGGEAPLSVGSRRALEGGLEVVAVSSVRPFMTALADYQQMALFGLMCLLGFSLVWMLVMGSGRGASAEAPAKEKKDKKKGKKGQEEAPAPAQVAAPLPVAPTQEPPVPGPDDFPFPASPARVAQAVPAAEPSGDAFPFPPPVPGSDAYAAAPASGGDAYPFASPPPVVDPYGSPTVPGKDPFAAQAGAADAFPFASGDAGAGVATAEARRGAFAFEDQPTAAYTLQQAADPFAAAAAQAGPAPAFGEDSPPETTRVAAIPQELLARSARPNTAEVPLPHHRPGHPGVAAPSSAPGTPMAGMMGMPPPPPPPTGNSAIALSEEHHFQDVFREFVVTREQCGEPNDGLTYDKFVAKLRKNKEQLVQKYACKTVRFQVYVKEGKAALKATPVKD
ncbi:MXAN_5187 family protein [Archangium lansingense]|uniref:Cell division protein FtsK n=1 Tax=Archangium lansingense TaxID=2995310 RepID=A0ABT4AF86_9BACT|nr:MXAN_5187 family protein [Archangium lansinium]MCY1080357.1 cell division protein FtsK [Archangium lansinium]